MKLVLRHLINLETCFLDFPSMLRHFCIAESHFSWKSDARTYYVTDSNILHTIYARACQDYSNVLSIAHLKNFIFTGLLDLCLYIKLRNLLGNSISRGGLQRLLAVTTTVTSFYGVQLIFDYSQLQRNSKKMSNQYIPIWSPCANNLQNITADCLAFNWHKSTHERFSEFLSIELHFQRFF